MSHPWQEKTALVTGGAAGIGAAVGEALTSRGATVVLADIDEAGAKERAASVGAARGVGLDISDREQFAEVVGDVIEQHGRLDLLFNIAGIGIGGEVRQLGPEHWDRVIDVNIRGTVHGIEAAYPHMIERGDGHIVNMASLAGFGSLPLLTPYAMSKHAIVGLTASLRAEAAEYGVRVCAVCPGAVETSLLDSRGPEDLPVVSDFDVRRYLMSILGKPYPVDRLAEDVLAGLAKDKPLIFAPAKARLFWRLGRFLPGLVDGEAVKSMRKERALWGDRLPQTNV